MSNLLCTQRSPVCDFLSLFAVNRIGVDGARALAAALKSNASLASINMSSKRSVLVVCDVASLTSWRVDNEIGDDGVEAMAIALRGNNNTSIESVDWTSEPNSEFVTATDVRGRERCWRRRRQSVGRRNQEQQIDSRSVVERSVENANHSSSDCFFVCFFCFVLFFFWCLIEDNQIGNEGAKALADALKSNATVTNVELRCKKSRCAKRR